MSDTEDSDIETDPAVTLVNEAGSTATQTDTPEKAAAEPALTHGLIYKKCLTFKSEKTLAGN